MSDRVRRGKTRPPCANEKSTPHNEKTLTTGGSQGSVRRMGSLLGYGGGTPIQPAGITQALPAFPRKEKTPTLRGGARQGLYWPDAIFCRPGGSATRIQPAGITLHDLDYMRSTTIGAGLDRRSQIAPTNFDLHHAPTASLEALESRRSSRGSRPGRCVGGSPSPDSLARPSFVPGRLRLRGASVPKWKIMAEMACGRKNPCSVAFRQQRG